MGESMFPIPAAIPGNRHGDHVMFVAMHGLARTHAGPNEAADSDAYSRFYARSSAMGWLSEDDLRGGDAWAMNDAGLILVPGEADPSYVVWFQVALGGPRGHNAPLPAQAFMQCADDVVTRMGAFSLKAADIQIPHALEPRSTGPSGRLAAVGALLSAARWFADADPGAAAGIRIHVHAHSHPSPTPVESASDLVGWMNSFDQSVCARLAAESHCAPRGLQVGDGLWPETDRHLVSLRGDLVEWSPVAMGWLTAFLAEAAYACDVRSPLRISFTRADCD